MDLICKKIMEFQTITDHVALRIHSLHVKTGVFDQVSLVLMLLMSSQVVFKMVKYNPVVINKALELGKRIFHIDDLETFQKDALTGLLQDRDVFLAYPTGSGKSAIYQLFPFVKEICEDILLGQGGEVPTNNASRYMVLVIQPLISLMKDQIT